MGSFTASIRISARRTLTRLKLLVCRLLNRENLLENYVERLLEFAHLCMIALLAACAKISYQTLHGKPFKFAIFLALLMVAIFAAFLAGSLLPSDFAYRDGVVGVAAWSGSEFVRAIELRLLAKLKEKDALKDGL